MNWKHVLDEITADADSRHCAKETGQPLGAKSAMPELDSVLGGAFMPGVHILHGAPGAGKSAFALQTVCECGCPAVFVTCEMSPVELLRRMAARANGIFLGRFKSGELTAAQVRALASQAIKAYDEMLILNATTGVLNAERLIELASSVRGDGHFLLVIDSVHTWSAAWGSGATEYDRLGVALKELQRIATVLNCVVLGIAERNRGAISTGGQSASAGHRAFEYCSETVMELNVANAGKPDAEGDKQIKLKISKNRHGETTSLDVLFNGAKQTFRKSPYPFTEDEQGANLGHRR